MAEDWPASDPVCVDAEFFDERADLPDLDPILDALANGTRRQALYYLLAERDATVEALADALIGWQLGTTRVVEPGSRERIVLALYHVHIPKLSEADLVEFDADADEVAVERVPTPVRKLVRYANRYDHAVENPRASNTEE